MSHVNSRNVTFIVGLLIVAALICTYLIVTQNINETIYTDVRQVNMEED